MSIRESVVSLLRRSDTAIEKQFDTVLDELACKVEQQSQEIAKLKAENERLKGKQGVLCNTTINSEAFNNAMLHSKIKKTNNHKPVILINTMQ